jgi:hypothetical protein
MLVVEIQSKHETGCSRLRLRTPTVRTDIDEDQRRGRTRNCGRAQPVQDVVTEPRAYGALDSRTSPFASRRSGGDSSLCRSSPSPSSLSFSTSTNADHARNHFLSGHRAMRGAFALRIAVGRPMENRSRMKSDQSQSQDGFALLQASLSSAGGSFLKTVL